MNWQMNYVPSAHFVALSRFLGGTCLAMHSTPVFRVPAENGGSQDVCLKYSFLDKLHFLLDFSLVVVTVFCLGYWVPNLKRLQQACFHGLQNMINIQQRLNSSVLRKYSCFNPCPDKSCSPAKKKKKRNC